MDITFSQTYQNLAVATIVVLDEKLKQVSVRNIVRIIDVPYVPSFLAFREIDPMIQLFEETKDELSKTIENFKIDCVFVDGNGILHP